MRCRETCQAMPAAQFQRCVARRREGQQLPVRRPWYLCPLTNSDSSAKCCWGGLCNRVVRPGSLCLPTHHRMRREPLARAFPEMSKGRSALALASIHQSRRKTCGRPLWTCRQDQKPCASRSIQEMLPRDRRRCRPKYSCRKTVVALPTPSISLARYAVSMRPRSVCQRAQA